MGVATSTTFDSLANVESLVVMSESTLETRKKELVLMQLKNSVAEF